MPDLFRNRDQNVRLVLLTSLPYFVDHVGAPAIKKILPLLKEGVLNPAAAFPVSKSYASKYLADPILFFASYQGARTRATKLWRHPIARLPHVCRWWAAMSSAPIGTAWSSIALW
jgi:hypothetical protein